MDSEIYLSRIAITGPVDQNTPKVVLKEIADSHGILFALESNINYIVHDNLIREINSDKKIEYSLKNMARFVNKYVEWEPELLKEAFGVLQSYANVDLHLPEPNFSYGLQIPSNIERLNACVLYRICKYLGLDIKFHHTIDQMAGAVQMTVCNEVSCRNFLQIQLKYINPENLTDLYLKACNFINLKVESEEEEMESSSSINYYEDIKLAALIFDDHFATLMRVTPMTPGEAITLAAKNFSIDISLCENPIPEYKNLLHTQSSWIPLDPEMKKKRDINPLMYNIGVYFNPRLPSQLYDSDSLCQLALNEGYTLGDLRREGAYSLLETSYLSETFYHGRHPTISNIKTPINWDVIKKLPSEAIICYGVINSDLKAFTYSELAEVILHNKNFVNPLDENCNSFTDLSLKKLKMLSKIVRSSESQEAEDSRKKLIRSIALGELFTREINVKIKDFYVFYNEATPENQINIHDILRCFLKLSMLTRGWDLISEYPIVTALVDNQHDVDVRVTQGIIDLEAICQSHEAIGDVFWNLPIMRYRGGWQISTDVQNGTTISERLQILKNGEEHENQNSCMRLTSNWFAASVWRYMMVIGLDPGFDVINLRSIS